MDMNDTRRLEMLMRVRNFGFAHSDSFPTTSMGSAQFVIINTIIEELAQKGASQASNSGSARQGTGSRAAARTALREDLKSLTRTARVMSLDMPGLESKFRMPRSGSDQALLNTARALAADAVPLKSQFIQYELEPEFLDALQNHIDVFEHAINSQNASRDAQVAATASIDAAIERGLTAVQRLDAIVRNKFRADAAALAAWESARHVERAGRATKKPDNAGPPA